MVLLRLHAARIGRSSPFPDSSPASPTEAAAALFTDACTAYAFADTPVDDATLTGIWELAR
ncbi:hypothetical protein [Streptomyces sp. NPDC016675]|uniref:hypothetical protein n=1 Tax=Streptomyces sp. NPDC016675 TaxID=3364970 RepID=UPI0036FBAB30